MNSGSNPWKTQQKHLDLNWGIWDGLKWFIYSKHVCSQSLKYPQGRMGSCGWVNVKRKFHTELGETFRKALTFGDGQLHLSNILQLYLYILVNYIITCATVSTTSIEPTIISNCQQTLWSADLPSIEAWIAHGTVQPGCSTRCLTKKLILWISLDLKKWGKPI